MDRVYTAEEVAERLQLTPRHVIKLGRRHGACSVMGRAYRFTEADVLAILEATRAEPQREKHVVVSTYNPRFITRGHSDMADCFRAPMTVDVRVFQVLRKISSLRSPTNPLTIERCGERTIDLLLSKHYIEIVGTTHQDRRLVRVTEAGAKVVKDVQAWERKYGVDATTAPQIFRRPVRKEP
jgi:chorismate mutase